MNAQDSWNWKQKTWLTIATGFLSVIAWEAFSDERPKDVEPHLVPVAIIDIGRVFENDSEFKAAMEKIKLGIGEYERKVILRQEEIKTQEAKHEKSPVGSAERTRLEEEILRLTAAMETDIKLTRKNFLAEEAHHYARRYRQIEVEVEKLCTEQRIGLVLRYSNDPYDTADREAVLKAVNRAVVWTRVPDLTREVLARLNKN